MKSTHQEPTFHPSTEGHLGTVSVPVIAEAVAGMTVNGPLWIESLCRPADREALAGGFPFNENPIGSCADLGSVHLCTSGGQVARWRSGRPTR